MRTTRHVVYQACIRQRPGVIFCTFSRQRHVLFLCTDCTEVTSLINQ